MTRDLRSALEDVLEGFETNAAGYYPNREFAKVLRSLIEAFPPSAQPNRDDIARMINPFAWALHDSGALPPDHEGQTAVVRTSRAHADTILAALPGRPEHEVKAEALTEAAEVWGDQTWSDAFMTDQVDDDISAVQSTTKWLRDRATQLENGQTP